MQEEKLKLDALYRQIAEKGERADPFGSAGGGASVGRAIQNASLSCYGSALSIPYSIAEGGSARTVFAGKDAIRVVYG